MMRYTDKTIPILCAECNNYEEGFRDMCSHVIAYHADQYTEKEALKAVEQWKDEAYEREEEFEMAYQDQRAIDRTIKGK